MRKKIISLFLIFMMIASSALAWGNQQLFDFTYTFNYAWIVLGDRIITEGTVESWKEFDDSDVIQVKIDGEYYYTHLCNVVLTTKK